jgi:hypothetical protein
MTKTVYKLAMRIFSKCSSLDIRLDLSWALLYLFSHVMPKIAQEKIIIY